MKRHYRIERDEWGYSIYNTCDGTRAEAGSWSLRREQRRLVVLEAFQEAYTLAGGPQEGRAYKRLYDHVYAMACYHGRKLANIPAIVADAIKFYDKDAEGWRA